MSELDLEREVRSLFEAITMGGPSVVRYFIKEREWLRQQNDSLLKERDRYVREIIALRERVYFNQQKPLDSCDAEPKQDSK